MVAWVVRDITTRSSKFKVIFLCGIFVLFGSLPAIAIYLLIRPERTIEDNQSRELFYAGILDKSITSCPECGELARQEYKFCPSCSASLDSKCPECAVQINPIWKYCANCNYALVQEIKTTKFMGNLRNRFARKKAPTTATLQDKPRRFQFIKNLNPINVIKPLRRLRNIRLPRVRLKISRPQIKLQLPKFPRLTLPRLNFSRNAVKPAIKIMAEKKHAPKSKAKAEVVVAPVPRKSKKTHRGRPKGIKDNRPRKKRADAGKSRGKYKK